MLIAGAAASAACDADQNAMVTALDVPASYRQLVLVTTDSWSSQTGRLERFERTDGAWCRVGGNTEVVVGKAGLAWGIGLHQPITALPQKTEGDKRGTAGVFLLGPAFGYASAPPAGTRISYQHATEADYFIDDAGSDDYNQWVRLPPSANEPTRRWKSFEIMKRADHLYTLGIVVQQNNSPVAKGRGSAIFLHVWLSPGVPTVGCTAMPASEIRQLITWLDPGLTPILVQAPRSELSKIRLPASR